MAHGAVPVAKLSYRCALAMRKRTLFASAGPVAVPIGPHNVVIRAHIETVKLLSALLALLAFFGFATCGFAAAKRIPLPRPRPADIARPEPPAEASTEEAAPPSASPPRLPAAFANGASRPCPLGPGRIH